MKSFNNYVITHAHTRKGSVGDSIINNKDYVKKAKELGMNSITITDHGSLSNMYSFYYECIENGIKPIIGCEVYFCEDRLLKDKEHKDNYHMILIAKNNNGIKNLLKLVSDASINGFYYKPRIDMDILKECHEDLICTTACVGGYAPQLVIQDELDKAIEHIKELHELFNDDLYLEIQPGEFPDQLKVNNGLISLSKELNIKLIATNDIHYINKEDWKTHDFHVRISRKMKAPEDPDDSVYVDKIYYMMSYEEFISSFNNDLYDKDIIKEAIDNTNELDQKVEPYDFNRTGLNLPEFEVPDGYTPKTYIEKLCLDRLNEIQYKITNPSVYVERVYKELDVIDFLGFSSYFLIMKDILDNVRDKGYLIGPGRGSACGSLIAWLLKITKIDPIKYNLLFERFLSVERKGSVPDIDIDFESGEGRDYAFEYTIKKYGLQHCAAVMTYGIRKSRSCIRSVCKLYDIDLATEDRIAKLIPQSVYEESEDGTEKKSDLSIEESLEIVPELREYQKIYPEIFEMAMKLEGLPDHTGIHAAGTLITNTPVADFAPMLRQESKELNAIGLDLHDAEGQKAVKFDYLAINNLNIIKECQKLTGDCFDQEFNNYDDPNIWKLIGSRNTTGLFQIGSNTYKQRMHRLKPTKIEELAACLALVRGPCIQSNLDEKYMKICEGREEIELIHPIYDEITKDTNGIMIYQEQIMFLCSALGLPLYDGYVIIKRAAKKDKDTLKTYEDKLWNLSKDKMSKKTFDTIFKMVLDSAKYSFNLSHALAYATLSYTTAYYKYYYPKEFYAATLTCMYVNKSGKTDEHKAKLQTIQNECSKSGIKFLPVEIDKSKYEFTVEDDGIRIGICSLAGCSRNAYDEIHDNCLPFDEDTSVIEQINNKVSKRKCSSKAVNALILIGALGEDIISLYEENYYLNAKKKEPDPPTYKLFISKVQTIEALAPEDEIELGLCNANFIHNKYKDLKPIDFVSKQENEWINGECIISKVTKRKYQGKKDMYIMNLETSEGTIEGIAFDKTVSQYKKSFKKDNKINFSGRKGKEEKIIINRIV